MSNLKHIFLLLLLIGYSICYGQDEKRIEELGKKLQDLSIQVPGINEKVDVSVSGVSIQEFLRAVANNAKVNINVDPSINFNVINNFSSVKVADMLIFLATEYDLKIDIIGSIITISQNTEKKSDVKTIQKTFKINYDRSNNQLSVELNNDSIAAVAKEITRLSGKNIILSSEIRNLAVSGYIQNMPFDNVLEKLAYANDLIISKSKDGFYLIEKKISQLSQDNLANGNNAKQKKNSSFSKNDSEVLLDVRVVDIDSISLNAKNASVSDVLNTVAEKLKMSCIYLSPVDGATSLSLNGVSFEELLFFILSGSDYTYKSQNGVYFFGEKSLPELRVSKNIQLQYRTIDKVIDVIPADIKKDLEVKEFPDLNSLLVSGPKVAIDKLELFIRQIDKTVPVVLIEVIIVDVTKKSGITTGIQAGLGTPNNNPTTGSIYPGIDLSFSTSSINNLINSFNGFGWFNLGKVTPNFYLSIKALEENGLLKLRSTPKLSTLNGHEAILSIGKTEYYLEEQNNVIGTQNPQNITTHTYKSVNADLSITIKPSVSGDEQVTLDVKVKQSDFTARISPSAPPGSVSRNFESLIRVKNQEMVLLGGLEENNTSNTGSGIPLLSRIPVVKWLFSSRSNQKSNAKLNIFIKPTIIY